MLFMERVVEVVSACECVDFVGELAYVGALLFEIGGPPSFLVRGWFGAGNVFFDGSVDGVFKVLEGRFEFGDGVKGVRDGELVKFCFHVLDEVVPFYFSPIISRGGGGSCRGDVERGDDWEMVCADGALRGEDIAFNDVLA